MDDFYLDKLKKSLKGRIFICVDAANLEHSVRDMWVDPKDVVDELKSFPAADLCYKTDYLKIKEFFSSLGDLKETRFYTPDFQTSGHRKFLSFLENRKYKLVTKPLKEYTDHSPEHPHRKANFDVEIAVDSIFRLDDFETFILFSGDCDFEYLLKFLRGQGKIAIVFSSTGHISKELPPASSYYFDIVDFRHHLLKMAERKAKDPTFRRGPAVD